MLSMSMLQKLDHRVRPGAEFYMARGERRSGPSHGFDPFPKIDAALQEAEARLGRDCTLTYHPHLEEQTYFTRVHLNGA